jgi:hypothetical protein
MQLYLSRTGILHSHMCLIQLRSKASVYLAGALSDLYTAHQLQVASAIMWVLVPPLTALNII